MTTISCARLASFGPPPLSLFLRCYSTFQQCSVLKQYSFQTVPRPLSTCTRAPPSPATPSLVCSMICLCPSDMRLVAFASIQPLDLHSWVVAISNPRYHQLKLPCRPHFQGRELGLHGPGLPVQPGPVALVLPADCSKVSPPPPPHLSPASNIYSQPGPQWHQLSTTAA